MGTSFWHDKMSQRGKEHEKVRAAFEAYLNKRGFQELFKEAKKELDDLGFPRIPKEPNLNQLNFPTLYALFTILGQSLKLDASPPESGGKDPNR